MFTLLALIVFFSIVVYLSFVINLGFKDNINTVTVSIFLGVLFGFIGAIILTNMHLNIGINEYKRSAYVKSIIETRIENQQEIARVMNTPIKFDYEKHLSKWEKFSWNIMNFNFDIFEDNRSYYIEKIAIKK